MLIIILVFFPLNGGDAVKGTGVFYVLQATHAQACNRETDELKMGLEPFVKRGCKFRNCFMTYNASYFQNINNFDAVLLDSKEMGTFTKAPSKRSKHQKYVFLSTDSLANVPMDPKQFDGFFNWTWTYRLDSDIPFAFITIRNALGEIIGPRKDMHWIDNKQMKPTTENVKRKLINKSIAAAWFVSNCETKGEGGEFVQNLSRELDEYGERIDIFGPCGFLKCQPNGLEESCYAKLEKHYYFYLAFENSFSEDYVTDKLLIPLQHFTVPIVYGGANYSRFLPRGSYLDARVLGPTTLALKMVHILRNKWVYYNFFKWHRYYSFHDSRESAQTDGYCTFCATLNDNNLRSEISSYANFSLWWNNTLQINSSTSKPEILLKNTMPAKPKDKPPRNVIKEFLSNIYKYIVKSLKK